MHEQPAACAELWWGRRLTTVRVDLDHIDAAELAELLRDAWEHKAPARLRG